MRYPLKVGVFLFLALLAGCDRLRSVQALVLDAETGAPIEGARVRERSVGGNYEYEYFMTNDSGLFEFTDISGGFR